MKMLLTIKSYKYHRLCIYDADMDIIAATRIVVCSR